MIKVKNKWKDPPKKLPKTSIYSSLWNQFKQKISSKKFVCLILKTFLKIFKTVAITSLKASTELQ